MPCWAPAVTVCLVFAFLSCSVPRLALVSNPYSSNTKQPQFGVQLVCMYV